MMALLFGNLVNAFVNFGKTVSAGSSPNATPDDIRKFQQARADFKHDASLDALYLTSVGIGMFVATYAYMVIWVGDFEHCVRRLNNHFPRELDIHRRSEF